MSRAAYYQVRVILSLCEVNLPGWDTLRNSRTKIRKLMDHTSREKKTALGKDCFSLNAEEIISHVSHCVEEL